MVTKPIGPIVDARIIDREHKISIFQHLVDSHCIRCDEINLRLLWQQWQDRCETCPMDRRPLIFDLLEIVPLQTKEQEPTRRRRRSVPRTLLSVDRVTWAKISAGAALAMEAFFPFILGSKQTRVLRSVCSVYASYFVQIRSRVQLEQTIRPDESGSKCNEQKSVHRASKPMETKMTMQLHRIAYIIIIDFQSITNLKKDEDETRSSFSAESWPLRWFHQHAFERHDVYQSLQQSYSSWMDIEVMLEPKKNIVSNDAHSSLIYKQLTLSWKLSGRVFAPTNRLTRNVFQSACRCSIPNRIDVRAIKNRASSYFEAEPISPQIVRTIPHNECLYRIGFARNPSMNRHRSLHTVTMLSILQFE